MLVVRVASENDLESLLSLWRDLEDVQGSLRVFPMSSDAEERITASFREAFSRADADVILAIDEDEAVGMVLVHVERPSRMSEDVAVELSRMVVRANRRGQRIGRSLVEAAAEWARARRIPMLLAAVFTSNDASRRFWRAEGFEVWVERMIRRV